ncbi:MAG: XrtA system polysaccharide deacetylase [bacterium]|jgi:polysaccharide deacetylase family protein (PEP-CTERM system associated)
MENILTFDIEEYYHSENFKGFIDKKELIDIKSRINIGMDRILSILKKHKVKATFFVLASLLENGDHNWLNQINSEGHEIALHSYYHDMVCNKTREEFENEVFKGKKIIESLTGTEIVGFRAPNYSITKESLWTLDSLKKLGFLYDSSIFPIFHDRYGIPSAERYIHKISDNFIEVPISTVRYLGINFPACGGGYFRLYPYRLIKHFIKKMNSSNVPAIVYLHPWEFDPSHPRHNIKGFNKFRQFVNINRVEIKLNKLLNDFSFVTAKDYLLQNIM